MVLLLIKIDLKTDYLGDGVFRLNEILKLTGAQEGCCGFSVSRHQEKQERLLLVAEWDSETAVKSYLQTDEFKLIVKATKTFGRNFVMSLANVLPLEFELATEQNISPLQGVQGL
jgi:quinol monooxygenase YgiN